MGNIRKLQIQVNNRNKKENNWRIVTSSPPIKTKKAKPRTQTIENQMQHNLPSHGRKEERRCVSNVRNQDVPNHRITALTGWKSSFNSMATSPSLLHASAVRGRCLRESAWMVGRWLVKIPKYIEGWSYYLWHGLYTSTLHTIHFSECSHKRQKDEQC